jgi:arylsulfatase A-like enzyme
MDDIENIVLIGADAVRYDKSVEYLQNRGQTFRTVAPSLHTGPSFASILTGQHVPHHGVHGFNRALSDSTPTLFDLLGDLGYM